MGVGTREYVVLVARPLRPDTTIHQAALLIQRCLPIDQIPVTLDISMEIGDIWSDPDAVGVVPRPVANPIPRVYGLLRVCAIRARHVRSPAPASVPRR